MHDLRNSPSLNQVALRLKNQTDGNTKKEKSEISSKVKEEAKNVIEDLQKKNPQIMEAVLKELNNLKLSNDGSKSLGAFTDEEDILIQSDAEDNAEIPSEGKGARRIINTQFS